MEILIYALANLYKHLSQEYYFYIKDILTPDNAMELHAYSANRQEILWHNPKLARGKSQNCPEKEIVVENLN